MGLGDSPFGGLISGFAKGLSESITAKAEEKRARIAQEAKFLNEVLNDAAGQYSQADRDAAIFALAELARGDKPGTGFKSFEKRRKELMEQQTALATGKVAGGGAVAGPTMETQPVIGGGAPQPGGPPPSAPTPGPTPGRPAEYRPGGAGAPPAAAAPAGPPAALPAASPTTGSPVGAPPVGAPAGPQVPRETPPGGPQAPPAGPIAAPDGGQAPGGPPSAQEVEAFGREIGLTPPAKPTPPTQPNPYTARKLDLEFYKADMLQYKTDQRAYTEWFERVAIQMRQERKQKETQDFQARESEKARGFKKEEGEKDRASRERAAKLRGAGSGNPGDKEAAMVRRQAIATYHRELNDIEDARDEFGVGKLDERGKQARRERAAANYRAATGEDPPQPGALDVKPMTSRTPAAPAAGAKPGAGVKVGGPPPAVAQTLDELPGGEKIRSRIEAARRQKVDNKKICADIAQLPKSHQEAAKLYARCP